MSDRPDSLHGTVGEAATTAGKTDYDAVNAALNKGTFKTALGDLSFDSNGDVTLPG